jgi:transposase
LERREHVIACCPEDCHCAKCGQERPVIGYETREELVCEPAKFWVRVIKREKRGSHCEEEQGVATAAAPAQIVPKSKLSNEFIIEAVVRKYQQHLPVYRQCAVLAEDYGIELSRKTLTDAILAAGGLLGAVVRAQQVELLAGAYIQADETPIPCQTGEKTGRNHQASMWEFSWPGGIVVFDFRMGRGRAGPLEFLKGFRGKLQSDGYAAYDELGQGIVYVGCMAHARRGFVDAAKVAPLNPLPAELIERFAQLYAVEKEAREGGLGPEARLALRQAKSVPVMAALKTRLVEIRQPIPPDGKLAQACDYALGQWSRLEEYLKDGRIEIDNNWCEGAMRPWALGRKNWLHIGSPEAGPKVAAIGSIVETCRRLDINLRAYLGDVLPKLGQWPINRVAELTPTAWKAAQAKKV